MPPEVLERIFEPFFTTKRLGEGSGLGLSMVYGFVRQSGGQILVDSTPGEGTAVRLYLPRARAEEGAEKSANADREGTDAGNEVFVVVEDDPASRTLAATILRDQGYQVAEAADAASALNRLQTLSRLDLLLTDVALPNGGSGFELAQTVLRLRPQARVLFASGHAGNPIAAENGWRGEVDLIAKPYRGEQLTRRIRAQLEQPFSSAVRAIPAADAAANEPIP
jgi:CheY-like chemotaxis protein